MNETRVAPIETYQAIINAMREGEDREFNAQRVLAAIQNGRIPGVTVAPGVPG